MKLYKHIVLCLVLNSSNAWGQANHWKAFAETLRYNQIGKVYSFDKSRHYTLNGFKYHDYDSLVLVYLGTIQCKKGPRFKILNSRYHWGVSCKGTTRIIVFNSKDQYLGDYYQTPYDAQTSIEGTNLVFKNLKGSGCTSRKTTKINFGGGIPKQFFIECKNGLGDFYPFSQNLK